MTTLERLAEALAICWPYLALGTGIVLAAALGDLTEKYIKDHRTPRSRLNRTLGINR